MEAEHNTSAPVDGRDSCKAVSANELLFNILSGLANSLVQFSEEFGLSILQVFHHSLEINSPGDVDKVIRNLVDSHDEEKLQRLLDDIRVHHVSLIGSIDQIGCQVISQLESEDRPGKKSGFLKSDKKIRNRMNYYRKTKRHDYSRIYHGL